MQALESAGFQAELPTVWLAEGLCYYLPERAVEVLLQVGFQRLIGLLYGQPEGAHHAPYSLSHLSLRRAGGKNDWLVYPSMDWGHTGTAIFSTLTLLLSNVAAKCSCVLLCAEPGSGTCPGAFAGWSAWSARRQLPSWRLTKASVRLRAPSTVANP